MKDFLARLNPTERRFVVGVAVLFFIVGNVVWVFPHFGDWSQTRQRMNDSSQRLSQFAQGTNQIPDLQKEIDKFERKGESVPGPDQAIHFVRLIQNQAAQSGVIPLSMNSARESGTNQFFVEQAENITLQSTEKQLVNFLYNLGAGDSLIRVRVLSVQPDQSHTLLSSRATLVASYQKAPPAARTGALPPARTFAPAATQPKKPAATAPQKPAPAPTPARPEIVGPPGAVPGQAPQRNTPGAKPGQTNLVPPAKSSTPNKK